MHHGLSQKTNVPSTNASGEDLNKKIQKYLD